MWWDRSSRVEAYLGRSLVGCRLTGKAGLRWQATAGVEEGLAALRHWCGEDAAPKRLRIWLGASLARPWMLAADAGVRSTAEARMLAASMAREVTAWDEAPHLWTAPWRTGRPTACVAVPREVHAALLAKAGFAGGAHVRVESVRPWWNQVFDERLACSAVDRVACGWSLAEPDGLVCGLVREGRPVELRFEAVKVHDPHWTLLRRRLAMHWSEADVIEHRRFAPLDAENATQGIAVAQPLDGEGQGA